jgi:hypothetical protein
MRQHLVERELNVCSRRRPPVLKDQTVLKTALRAGSELGLAGSDFLEIRQCRQGHPAAGTNAPESGPDRANLMFMAASGWAPIGPEWETTIAAELMNPPPQPRSRRERADLVRTYNYIQKPPGEQGKSRRSSVRLHTSLRQRGDGRPAAGIKKEAGRACRLERATCVVHVTWAVERRHESTHGMRTRPEAASTPGRVAVKPLRYRSCCGPPDCERQKGFSGYEGGRGRSGYGGRAWYVSVPARNCCCCASKDRRRASAASWLLSVPASGVDRADRGFKQ